MSAKTLKQLAVCLSAALFVSCASTPEGVRISLNPKVVKDPAEIQRFDSVIAGIEERNKTLEDSQEWLREAYAGLNMKRLNDIPAQEFGEYGKFLYRGEAYIVMHPAFFVFFENDRKLSSKSDKEAYPKKNIVERFFDKYYAYDFGMTVMKEQERLLRDFVEAVSTEKRLLILIVPKDYRSRVSYGYIGGLDEYARYLNEITNGSESVLYMETKEFEYGYMSDADMGVLKGFFGAVGAKRIIIGGSYVGRCLNHFYSSMRGRFDNVYIAPEIAAVSPGDLDNKWGRNLLNDKGRIKFRVAARNLRAKGAYGIPVLMPPDIRPLYYYRFYSSSKK